MSVSPTDGNGPTQGHRKTLTRVGIEPTTFGLDHPSRELSVKPEKKRDPVDLVVAVGQPGLC